MPDQSLLARLPKVDQLLARPELSALLDDLPRSVIKEAVRIQLERMREGILAGAALEDQALEIGSVARAAAERARDLAKPSLRGLINATGVVVHTNLGRSLLAESALQRLLTLNRTYTNLEYNLEAGRRGSRYDHASGLLADLTGAEAAIVVNNNAAAVFLCLQTLAQGREVIVSRGQLVEIGGSFRIPDVMARSGAILKEVGATNKTHLHDYENAITSQTALLLKVHTSNFAVVGFHKEVPLEELRELADRYHLPVMEDLGSGTLMDFSRFGLAKEPTVQEAVAAGADIVTFSGDKLMGGPQAGIILGRKELVEAVRKNPVNRAMRIDKLTLAALEATLELYREPEKALELIPTLRMISTPYDELRSRAANLMRRLNRLGLPKLKVATREGASRVGGGALPLAALLTRLLEITVEGMSATKLEAGLRAGDPPIICRLEDGQLLMDVRTLLPGDDKLIADALAGLAA
jgi:L-seryl-tRNA(Ser) seleniumtransferase